MGGGVLRASGFYGFYGVVEDVALRVLGFWYPEGFPIRSFQRAGVMGGHSPKPTEYPKP